MTPTPLNSQGAKGIGEAGTIGSTPCAVAAAVDALSGFGVRHIDMLLRPEKPWGAAATGSRAPPASLPYLPRSGSQSGARRYGTAVDGSMPVGRDKMARMPSIACEGGGRPIGR